MAEPFGMVRGAGGAFVIFRGERVPCPVANVSRAATHRTAVPHPGVDTPGYRSHPALPCRVADGRPLRGQRHQSQVSAARAESRRDVPLVATRQCEAQAMQRMANRGAGVECIGARNRPDAKCPSFSDNPPPFRRHRRRNPQRYPCCFTFFFLSLPKFFKRIKRLFNFKLLSI